MLPIGGFVPFSTIDFPNTLSAVLFCQGCPWRCRYCHNTHLQTFAPPTKELWKEFLIFLENRKSLLEGVVFSGGEPSLHHALPDAIEAVKELGYLVGIHTAGPCPDRLENILPLVDWVGMDIKAPFSKYEQITGQKNSGELARQSAKLVIQSEVDYEFRTTVHPDLLSTEDIKQISTEILTLGAQAYVLQMFRKEGCRDEHLSQCAPRYEVPFTLAEYLSPRFASFSIR